MYQIQWGYNSTGLGVHTGEKRLDYRGAAVSLNMRGSRGGEEMTYLEVPSGFNAPGSASRELVWYLARLEEAWLDFPGPICWASSEFPDRLFSPLWPSLLLLLCKIAQDMEPNEKISSYRGNRYHAKQPRQTACISVPRGEGQGAE